MNLRLSNSRTITHKQLLIGHESWPNSRQTMLSMMLTSENVISQLSKMFISNTQVYERREQQKVAKLRAKFIKKVFLKNSEELLPKKLCFSQLPFAGKVQSSHFSNLNSKFQRVWISNFKSFFGRFGCSSVEVQILKSWTEIERQNVRFLN